LAVLPRRFPERTEENHENPHKFEQLSPQYKSRPLPLHQSVRFLAFFLTPIRIIRLTFCLYIFFQDSLTPKPTPFSSHQCRVSPLLMVSRDVWRERKRERERETSNSPRNPHRFAA